MINGDNICFSNSTLMQSSGEELSSFEFYGENCNILFYNLMFYESKFNNTFLSILSNDSIITASFLGFYNSSISTFISVDGGKIFNLFLHQLILHKSEVSLIYSTYSVEYCEISEIIMTDSKNFLGSAFFTFKNSDIGTSEFSNSTINLNKIDISNSLEGDLVVLKTEKQDYIFFDEINLNSCIIYTIIQATDTNKIFISNTLVNNTRLKNSFVLINRIQFISFMNLVFHIVSLDSIHGGEFFHIESSSDEFSTVIGLYNFTMSVIDAQSFSNLFEFENIYQFYASKITVDQCKVGIFSFSHVNIILIDEVYVTNSNSKDANLNYFNNIDSLTLNNWFFSNNQFDTGTECFTFISSKGIIQYGIFRDYNSHSSLFVCNDAHLLISDCTFENITSNSASTISGIVSSLQIENTIFR